MKILMIAPEPFFEPRGTPFSEYFRIKALCALGHQVDLVTYPIGEDKQISGLRIFRSWKPFFVKSVKTGPSFVKVILDFFLFFSALRRLIRGRKKYHLIHTHEEANIMGVFFNKLTKIPHLYDMHSSLVQQMSNFQYTRSKIISGLMKAMEKTVLENACSVIVICRALYDYAAGITDESKLVTIENFIDDGPEKLDGQRMKQIKEELVEPGKKIVMYTGTLEAYQGIPLLIDSMNYLGQDFQLVLIGGNPFQVDKLNKYVNEKNFHNKVRLLGRRESSDIPYFLKNADVLVSPRTLGTNIPLKIYAYLKSGIPVVASDLFTHTQTLNHDIAILVKPEPQDLAHGIEVAVTDIGLDTAKRAKAFCDNNYSYQRYLDLVNDAIRIATGGADSG
jgi:glycosyltransferase involved in cell wall biosynthesis